MDYRKFHQENVAKLDPQKVQDCLPCIRKYFRSMTSNEICEMLKEPDWWIPHHFGSMMNFRNYLRDNGFGENYFGIDNLDDYAVGLIEYCFGVII